MKQEDIFSCVELQVLPAKNQLCHFCCRVFQDWSIVDTIPREYIEGDAIPYGGVPLRLGAESDDVLLLQQYLNYIAERFPSIPTVNTTGYFGPRTEEAVIAFQNLSGITPTGIVSAVTWSAIADLFNQLSRGNELQEGQFPGFSVGA